MCLNRNRKAINALEGCYPLDAVFSATKKGNLDAQLKAKLCKLMLNLYVDRDPLQKLNLPGYTRVWNEIKLNEAQIEIMTAKPPVAKKLKKI